jgi:hypothetical protein
MSVEWSWTHGGGCQRDGHGGPCHHQDGLGSVVIIMMGIRWSWWSWSSSDGHGCHTCHRCIGHDGLYTCSKYPFGPFPLVHSLLLKKIQRLIWIQYGLNNL